jgi:hypothetical protein
LSGSITTRNFSFDIAIATFFLLGSAASGLKPCMTKPLTLPWYRRSKMASTSYAPSRLGSQS